jgi:regulator of cell morphogenesis and NO signaling
MTIAKTDAAFSSEDARADARTPSSLDRATTLAEIVLDHPECARVLQAHRLDFCCRGELSLSAACAGKGLDADAVLSELERAVARRRGAAHDDDPRALSTPELVERIVSRHHAYLYDALPFLEPLAAKVARGHGEHNPKLAAMLDTLRELRAELEPHLDDEEQELFPALMRAREGEAVPALAGMREEHLRVGELLTTMRTQADDYVAPDWACGSYRTLVRELEALEADTLQHIHLENHVLAPRFARAGAGRSTLPALMEGS